MPDETGLGGDKTEKALDVDVGEVKEVSSSSSSPSATGQKGSSSDTDAEMNQPEEKLPFPKAIGFIIGNEFCERFSFFGMKAILPFYLSKKLHSEDLATDVYHTFNILCYFTPLFGAMIADSWLGKFKTIMYLSLVYVLGHLIKTLASIPTLGIPAVEFSLLGLFLIAVGTGGIKPCVAAFGGDQFKLPQQERQLQSFFSIFYVCVNVGALSSMLITPALRQDVHCFEEDHCYAAAFGVPALLMALATVILFAGKNLFVMKAPQGNIFLRVAGSIWYSLRKNNFWIFGRNKNKKSNKGGESSSSHWMDVATEAYPSSLVEDVKLLLNVLYIFLPLPIYWCLYDQQGSRWAFQADRMDGILGAGAIVKPDQIGVINPIIVMFLVPAMQKWIYPCWNRCNFLTKPLQRMTAGGSLVAVSFVISGILELSLMSTYEFIPRAHESHLHLMNGLACPAHVAISQINNNNNSSNNNNSTFFFQHELSMRNNTILRDLQPARYSLRVRVDKGGDCSLLHGATEKEIEFEAVNMKVLGILIRADADKVLRVEQLPGFERPKKMDEGAGNIRVVYDDVGLTNLQFRPYGERRKEYGAVNLTSSSSSAEGEEGGGVWSDGDKGGSLFLLETTNYTRIPPSLFQIYNGDDHLGELYVGQGGVRTLYITAAGNVSNNNNNNNSSNNNSSSSNSNNSSYVLVDFVLTKENSLHMFWQIPQYIFLTTGEILFAVTGLEFAYSQAPGSMKSVIQAAWILMIAFGNVLFIIVKMFRAFSNQAHEFFMFSGLLFADMILFAVMSYFYKTVDVATLEHERKKREEKEEAENNNNNNNSNSNGNSNNSDEKTDIPLSPYSKDQKVD